MPQQILSAPVKAFGTCGNSMHGTVSILKLDRIYTFPLVEPFPKLSSCLITFFPAPAHADGSLEDTKPAKADSLSTSLKLYIFFYL